MYMSSTKSPLSPVDKKEFATLLQLEGQFDSKLNALKSAMEKAAQFHVGCTDGEDTSFTYGGGLSSPAIWRTCAQEGGVCPCKPGGQVRFGNNKGFLGGIGNTAIGNILENDGEIQCSSAEFGDPDPGEPKCCQCAEPRYLSYNDHVMIMNQNNTSLKLAIGQAQEFGGQQNVVPLVYYNVGTPYSIFSLRPANPSTTGPIKYGDSVIIASAVNPADNGGKWGPGGNTSNCGMYGCRVLQAPGLDTQQEAYFGHGGDAGSKQFVLYNPAEGLPATGGYIREGMDQVAIAWLPDSTSGYTENCGWFGCRVLSYKDGIAPGKGGAFEWTHGGSSLQGESGGLTPFLFKIMEGSNSEKDILHWVGDCNQCGKNWCNTGIPTDSNATAVARYNDGTWLSQWGCDNLMPARHAVQVSIEPAGGWSAPSGAAGTIERGGIFVVEPPPNAQRGCEPHCGSTYAKSSTAAATAAVTPCSSAAIVGWGSPDSNGTGNVEMVGYNLKIWNNDVALLRQRTAAGGKLYFYKEQPTGQNYHVDPILSRGRDSNGTLYLYTHMNPQGVRILSTDATCFADATNVIIGGPPPATISSNPMDGHIDQLNNELQDIANQIWIQTQKIQTEDKEVMEQIRSKRKILKTKLQTLQTNHNKHGGLKASIRRLNTKLQQDRSDLTSTYAQYLVWFLASGILGALVIQQLRKRLGN